MLIRLTKLKVTSVINKIFNEDSNITRKRYRMHKFNSRLTAADA